MHISKKNKLFTVITLVFTSLTFAQTVYLNWSDTKTAKFGNEIIYKHSNTDKFLNGDYKIAETSGSYSEITFKNGKISGEKKDFDFTGKLEYISNYKDGKPNGKSTSYFQDGTINEENNFENGLKHGTWKSFDKKGKLKNTENYEKDKKTGKWIQNLYYPQTGLHTVVTKYYKNDKATGTWQEIDLEKKLRWTEKYTSNTDYKRTEYFPNEKVKSIERFVDRKLEGVGEYYNQAGVLLRKRNYTKGHIKFENKYYGNGNLEEVTHFKNGNEEGVYEYYNEVGIKTVEGLYKDSYKHGEWTLFNEDGELKTTYTLINNVKNGIAKTYNEAARVASEGMYVKGEKDGLWKVYKLNGKIDKEIEYKLGKVISEKEFK